MVYIDYFGGAFTSDTVKVFLEKLEIAEPYGNLIKLPESCELAVRVKEGRKYLFVLNYLAQSAKINLTVPVWDLWTREILSGECELDGYGTMVCRLLESSER